MALPGNVVTAINAVALKMNQRDPGANATGNNTLFSNALIDWPNGTRGLFGPMALTTARATAWCTVWFPALGVDATSIQTLRTFFGV